VVLAAEEARTNGEPFVDTEHILLGLLGVGQGVAFEVLAGLGLTLDGVRAEVGPPARRGEPAAVGHVPFTSSAKRALELSMREALQLGHNWIGPEHLLLGLLRHDTGVALQVLTDAGVDAADVRGRLVDALGREHRAVDDARRAEVARVVAEHVAGLVRFAVPPAMWGDVVDAVRNALSEQPT